MEPSGWVALISVAFAIGIVLGRFITDINWKTNSKVPARVLKHNRFYKVIDIKSKHSWEMADIHRSDIEEK